MKIVNAENVQPGDVLLSDDGEPFREEWRSTVREVRHEIIIVFNDYQTAVYHAGHELDVR